MLHAPSDMADSLDSSKEGDAAVLARLKEQLGDFFAQKVAGDAAWARGILDVSPSET